MVQFVNKLRANKITNITNDFKMDVIIIILILMLMSIFKMTMKTLGCFLFFVFFYSQCTRKWGNKIKYILVFNLTQTALK